MNEVIRQLAEQTGLAEAADVREGYIYPEGLEEFVARMIKMCGEFTDPVTRKLMMKHFGVK